MKKIFERTPFYLFLLPIFFIWHGFNENFGNITFLNCLLLTVTYLGASAFLYFISLLFFKGYIKASLFATFLMGFYCFFGALQDFLKYHAHPISRYSVLLSLFIISVIALGIYLKRTKRSFFRLSLLLNLVFSLYILIDFADISWKIISPPASQLAVYSPDNYKDSIKICADCPRPDIYFLLFDAYTGTRTLKERFGYDNSDLDSFLLQNGFSIQSRSRSNYFFTPFSMASTLNMQYLTGIPNPNACTLDDYEHCINMVRENEVIKILSRQGYDIINYSVFDLAGNPSRLDESFLPLKTKLITESTLFARMRKDMGWILTINKINFFSGNIVYQTLINTNKCIENVKKESELESKRPRFIYAHFYLPHAPFYFDKFGNPKKESDILHETKEFSLQAYLDYLPYAKKRVEELIGAVKKNTEGKAVILFMSDHGFNNEILKSDHVYSFQNQNAVYFPDRDYAQLYDSITNVNQFRVILNTLFKQNLPLIKDSTIFLFDKNKTPH
jgi:hypothetical protein